MSDNMFDAAIKAVEKDKRISEEQEWQDIKAWVSGSAQFQQETIIDGVLITEKKSKRPHLKKLIEKTFRLISEQHKFDNMEHFR